ncbi:inner membrane isoform B [Chlorella sorokiniana]|uniref:Inner membrane isoform B n=1 Tax=Chlorella sorokiniana TaxID=3076 RepID=A0A2P6TVH4_CHLSO|nr:inner membrane isoform B [Chlorella sorokiniana]|eukprot:PRW58073.1 inner membrane isoform B [Chlorella sorokiniana]
MALGGLTSLLCEGNSYSILAGHMFAAIYSFAPARRPSAAVVLLLGAVHMALGRWCRRYPAAALEQQLVTCLHALFSLVYACQIEPYTYFMCRLLFDQNFITSLLTFYPGAFTFLNSHLALYTIEAGLRLVVRRNWLLLLHHSCFFAITAVGFFQRSFFVLKLAVLLPLFIGAYGQLAGCGSLGTWLWDSMAAQQRLKALGRKLDRLVADGPKPVDFWADDNADTWTALHELSNPGRSGPAVHREQLEVLRTTTDLLPELLRAVPALQAAVPEGVIFVAGLLHVGSKFHEILLEVLDKPIPGCRPPPDDHCYAATAWTAALLGPAAALLRLRDPMATSVALTGAAQPLKQLVTRLQLSKDAPFGTALRSGAARPQLLAEAIHEMLGAAIYVQRVRGFSEASPTSTWKDCAQVLTILHTPLWKDTLQQLLHARPAASQEAAALQLRYVRHAALEAAGAAYPADDTPWRQVATCACGACDTDGLVPEVSRFMQGSEGDSVQQALASFLAALPRKPPGGKPEAHHAVLLCLAALATLKLQSLAVSEERVAEDRAVATLRLCAEVAVAATEALSAASQYCGAALASEDPLGSGLLQQLQCREVWHNAQNAWYLAHIGQETVRAGAALLQQAVASRSPEQRAEAWSAVGSLAAAGERLLRLLPKLPSSNSLHAAAMSPASIQTEGALFLGRAAAEVARYLSTRALQQQELGQERAWDAAAAAAAAASAPLSALAFTLAKRALLAMLAGSAEGANNAFMAEYGRIWPVIRVLAVAAEALGGPIPEAQQAVQHLRRMASECAPGPSSTLVRRIPNNSGPPEMVEMLALRQLPCCNPRCCNLAGASESQLKGKLCTGCRTARFCCMACSKAAWKEHKVACKHMQRQLAEAAAAGEEGQGEGGAQQ